MHGFTPPRAAKQMEFALRSIKQAGNEIYATTEFRVQKFVLNHL
jgi:hypothetical protein